MGTSFKNLLIAALLFGGAAATQPSPASAQSHPSGPSLAGPTEAYAGYYRYGRYYPRTSDRRFYGGYRSGYRPDYYGYRRYGSYRPYYYRRGYSGGALGAGLIGGLALGTLARPYSYPPRYYGPAYVGRRCVLERRRVVNRHGRRVWRRVQVCY